ncbi:hypothetical protein [Agromyces salentinus]|uniref:Glycosyltransferase n=1 Tax=Agromyces salentinus TaxID=269421 RepID=A0ABN2MX08_9MICO|nr:hypothetical protein [Agromyces salentinus]
MFELSGRRVLITQAHVQSYGGSEIVTHELAEYFSGRGAEVVVATAFAAEPMATELSSTPGVRIADIRDPEFLAEIAASPPHLAWIHHQLIPAPLLADPGRTVFVFNHMSFIHPLEFPYSPTVEAAFADLSLFVSEEIRERQVPSGLHEHLDPRRVDLFNNPAPGIFARGDGTSTGMPLPRLLAVTNHLVEELREAFELLRTEFEIQIVGSEGAKGATPFRVTPEVIHAADAVITIGKTAQYALLAGVPVYCYDRFGGPGWLSPSNFERAARGHFRGSGFRQSDAETLATELRSGFEVARRDAAVLRDAYSGTFTLEQRLDALLGELDPRSPESKDIAPITLAQHLKTQEVILHYLHGNRRLEAAVTRARRESDARIADLRQGVEDVRQGHEHERERARKAEGVAKELRESREHERARARKAEHAAQDLRDEIAALRRALREARG